MSDGSDVGWSVFRSAAAITRLLCNSIPPMTARVVKAATEMTMDPPTAASFAFENLVKLDVMMVFR